ncbi:uncharacterized protein EI97DRAFT_439458 [Westerdykella ornata]|uniref:Uncharacterized protein n=1 Tax=Westerdykella ornata TaxID=318751 RepID=A0A6A6JW55_WESOR|nr:uncharacterized protein EI97DRAFT_439458 [Westerdykella ornata]KAF2280444.1 hypothetical protein EI97DRAFT_439458 [Westerdykella ornata]
MSSQDLRPRICLPGFGHSLQHWLTTNGKGEPLSEYLCALARWRHSPMTIRDRCMLAFMNEITDKPEWTRKVFNESIVKKWKSETMTMDWDKAGIPMGDFSGRMFDYCIAELRDKATFSDQYHMVRVLDIDAVILKSDNAVDAELNAALRSAVRPLEDVPDVKKDWHPGSDGKVLDLVHPSLFPLIYGRSRILPNSVVSLDDCVKRIGEGEVIPQPTQSTIQKVRTRQRIKEWEVWSKNFQWLPCNVTFPDGKNASIESYINNLHPDDHADLYRVIEQLITRSVPLFNIVCQFHPGGSRKQGHRAWTDAIEAHSPVEPMPPRPQDPTGEEDWTDDRRRCADTHWRHQWWMENRVMIKPEPENYGGLQYTKTPELIDNQFSFLGERQKNLQVIVKLANIHLTPEKPEYEGGGWHVEGQLNEHIIATALYYYDNENITDSRLQFRTNVVAGELEVDLDYMQNDHEGIEQIFGFHGNYDEAVQELGSVLTCEGRLIAFPNGFQHRVGGFKLADPTKPGHRKIVALFLVDPMLPIISTANVPPQQRDWWLRSIGAKDGALGERLPAELVHMVGSRVDDFPIGLEEAKVVREKLMEERGKLDRTVDTVYRDMYGCL